MESILSATWQQIPLLLTRGWLFKISKAYLIMTKRSEETTPFCRSWTSWRVALERGELWTKFMWFTNRKMPQINLSTPKKGIVLLHRLKKRDHISLMTLLFFCEESAQFIIQKAFTLSFPWFHSVLTHTCYVNTVEKQSRVGLAKLFT